MKLGCLRKRKKKLILVLVENPFLFNMFPIFDPYSHHTRLIQLILVKCARCLWSTEMGRAWEKSCSAARIYQNTGHLFQNRWLDFRKIAFEIDKKDYLIKKWEVGHKAFRPAITVMNKNQNNVKEAGAFGPKPFELIIIMKIVLDAFNLFTCGIIV